MKGSFVTASLSFLLVLCLASCSDGGLQTDPVPAVDEKRLDSAFSLAREFNSMKSLIVARGDAILREEYFGAGGADLQHDVRSVTKSVTSLLVGIAIDKGFIPSVDQPIGAYFDSLHLPPATAGIAVRHLLTMSSGLEGNELADPSEYDRWISARDQVRYVLAKPFVAAPGSRFCYNSGVLHLLSVIVSKASRMSTSDFAQKYLFDPLGIGTRSWEPDSQGYNNGGAGLSLTPHDMVKLGILVLGRGVYAGRRVVSDGWIDSSTRFRITTSMAVPHGPGYGYCWWAGREAQGDCTFAMGWGGQFIVIVPAMDIIVIATNEWKGRSIPAAGEQWVRTIDLIVSRIIPAIHR